MGLTIGGNHDQTRKGFDWLKKNQQKNGSWLAAYRDGKIEDGTERNKLRCIHRYGRMASTSSPVIDPFLRKCGRVSLEYRFCPRTSRIKWRNFLVPRYKKGIQYDCLLTGCSSILNHWNAQY